MNREVKLHSMVDSAVIKQRAVGGRAVSGLQSIADDLNLSVSLVSKVLNDRLGTSRVSKATLHAIQHRATQMGYTKNLAAAALVSGKQNAIGVFMHPLGVAGSGLPEAIVQAVAEQASLHGQRLLLKFFGVDEEFDAQRRTIHPSIMDGAIIAGVIHPELRDSVIEIEKSGTPIVTMFDEQIDSAITNIGTDQVEVGRLATAHLIEQGCRRIAHINVMLQRRQGYEAALVAAGLPVLEELINDAGGYQSEGSYEYGAGVAAVRGFIERGIVFDGVVAQSDQQATGALHAAIRGGLRVPEDVKIIGVDDSPPCQYSFVPQSSISQEFAECGKRAVQMLLAKIAGEVCPSEVVTPVLRARQSSARMQ